MLKTAEPIGKSEDGVADAIWLPEHFDNPFTRALGPPPTWSEQYDLLERKVEHDPSERSLPPHLRRYCVLRLFEVVIPLERHVELVERVHMIARQGYKARNPAKGLHKRSFLASAAAVQRFREGMSVEEAQKVIPVDANCATVGFTLLGDPGMGKTTTVDYILNSFPPVVDPGLPYHIDQIPALKVQCPSAGGRRQTSLAVIMAIDERLGTTYTADFEKARVTGDQMMLHAQHLVNLHAVGVLAIDEIQHLKTSTEGVDRVMNFLVTLVNLIGVPVVLIGTNEARPIVEGSFRNARRAAGLGQPNWPRMTRGEEWDDWFGQLWQYQWTNVETPLSPDISEAVFDESQGVIDIAVKLVMLAQFRAISRGEVYGESEVLSDTLIRQVAKDEFGSIQPMIRAMRDGRDDVLAEFPDLEDFHHHVDKVLSGEHGMSMKDFRHLRMLREKISEAQRESKEAPWVGIKASLLTRGYPLDVVDRVIAIALERAPADDVFAMMDVVKELLEGESKPTKAPRKKYVRGRKPKADSLEAMAVSADDVLAALKAAGVVRTVDDVLNGPKGQTTASAGVEAA